MLHDSVTPYQNKETEKKEHMKKFTNEIYINIMKKHL